MSDTIANLPLVSIVVPVFNGERYLRESLDSILAQTYPRTEIIVMDDASTDRTPEVVASYGDKVHYYRQAENRGIYGNMNDGIALAEGEYIAIYHADDVYNPRIVEREVEFLQQHPEAGAVFCKDIFINPEGQECGRLELVPEVRGGKPLDYRVILNTLLKYQNYIFRCPSCMVRASVYKELGGYRDQEFRNTSDIEMYLRISKNYPVGILDEYLFSYRWGHGNSGQRYRHLRTDPNRFFRIMDLYLAEGGIPLATPEALTDYEAHRAEDNLMRVVNHYILGQRREARAVLSRVGARLLVTSRRIQRGRLLVLLLLLRVLVRVPKIQFVTDIFYKRWHTKRDLSRPPTLSILKSKIIPKRREGWQN
jgi:glycosyltransferase involved in cell wall biosynthesis